MTTSTRNFQRQFKRMKEIAAQGKTIVVHDDVTGRDFLFSSKPPRKNPLLGCMPGSVKGDAESPTNEIWEANE